MTFWWLGDDKLLPIRYPYWDPREHGHPVPATEIEGGADKRRLCVSAEWVKHIVGVLDRLTRWDAWTGDDVERERAISNIERMMAQLSMPFDDCVEVVTVVQTVVETVIEYIGGGCAVGGCEDMPCINITDLIKIEDGKLWGRNSCCEWELIGEFPLSEAPPTENPTTGTGAEPEEWAPCGKIAGLVSAIQSMLDAAETSYGVPGDFIPAVRASVPGGVEMGRAALYLLWVDYVSFRKAFSYGTLTDAGMIQSMLCKGVLGMNDDGEVTYDEFSFAINSIKSAIYDKYDYATATAVWTVWEQCYQTLGALDCQFLMQLGAYNITADCDCAEVEPVYEWDYKYDLALASQGWQHSGIDGQWVNGTGYGSSDNGYLDLRREDWLDSVNSYLQHAEVTIQALPGTVNAAYSEGLRHQNTGGFVLLLDEAGFSAGSGEYHADLNLPLSMNADNILMQFKLCIEDNQPTGVWYVTRIRLAGFGTPPTSAPTHPYV